MPLRSKPGSYCLVTRKSLAAWLPYGRDCGLASRLNTRMSASRRVTLVAAGGLLAALSFGGVAQAITDTIFRYSTPRTGYFGIDHMAMTPRDYHSAVDYVVSWGSGLYAEGPSGQPGGCFNTGVNLPHGATMTRLLVWTRNPASTVNVYLYRHNLRHGTQDTVAYKQILDQSNTRIQTRINIADNALAVVNNAAYTYGFGVCMTASALFHGARVAYTYTHAGD